VRQIIKDHGAVLDLRTNPEQFIEIVRKHAIDLAAVTDEDGGLPGGVAPVGPTSLQDSPRIEDILKEVQKLQRQVAKQLER
jgi:hypothetical protein